MSQRRKFEVFILDKPYTVLSDGKEEIEQIAAFVDARIREAVNVGHAPNPEKAAVLAALNIAEALFRARREMDDFTKQLEAKASELADTIPD